MLAEAGIQVLLYAVHSNEIRSRCLKAAEPGVRTAPAPPAAAWPWLQAASGPETHGYPSDRATVTQSPHARPTHSPGRQLARPTTLADAASDRAPHRYGRRVLCPPQIVV